MKRSLTERLSRLPCPKFLRIVSKSTIEGDGHGLFRLACEHDLEGIVAKRKLDTYLSESGGWLKIRNSQYSQWINREELFERERKTEPSFDHWKGCVFACEGLNS